MKQHIQLQIPTPCHENWNTMTATDQGRFCKACCKEVIDFSVMTDREVLNYLSKAGSNVCGRVQDDQLNRAIQQPAEKKYSFPYLWRMLLASILVSNKLSAQIKPPADTVITYNTKTTTQEDVVVTAGMVLTTHSDDLQQLEIVGRVVDERNHPIPYASVIIKGSKQGVATDSAGFFKLMTRGKLKRTELLISSVGFEQQVVALKKNRNRQTNNTNEGVVTVDVNLVMLRMASLGLVEVVVSNSTLKRRAGAMAMCIRVTGYEKLKNSLLGVSELKVYPNPITSNGIFNLVFNTKQLGFHTLQFTDASGKIIHSSEINIVSKNQVQYFNASMFNAKGVYFASVSNKQSTRLSTVKLLVQ